MDAIERCLDVLDDGAMEEFVPRLADTIKQAVGTPTKVSRYSLICDQIASLFTITTAMSDAIFWSLRNRS